VKTAIFKFTDQPDIIKDFIDHKADVNIKRPKDEKSLLMVSAETGNAETINTLIDSGASPLDKDKEGKIALHHAAQAGKKKCSANVGHKRFKS